MIKMKKVFDFDVKPERDWVGTSFAPTTRNDRFGTLEPGEVRVFREDFALNGMRGAIHFPPSWGGRRVRVTIETDDEVNSGKQKPGETWRQAAHRTKKKEIEK